MTRAIRNAVHRRLGSHRRSAFLQFWLAGNAGTRRRLTEIANWIDANLADDPDQKGQLRADLGARIVPVSLADPSAHVAVTFEVSQQDRIVRIIRLTLRSL
jgi:hypothetical protein